MGLAYSEIDDAVLLTQNNFVKKGAFTDLQLDLQDHVAVREMWKGRKKTFTGGENWEWEAQIDHNHSAKTVGLYETDGSAIIDTMIKGEVEPRHVNAHYVYDKREKAFQRGGKAIVDYIKTKYVAMMCSWYKLLEEILWGKPADSTDLKTPYGIDYWITRYVATTGFHSVAPTGFTTKGGINPADGQQERWRNYVDRYVVVSKEDLLRKMRRAHRQIQFRSPVSHAQPTVGPMRNGIYTNDDVIGLMEELLEAQNMNLGNDLASKDGRTLFKSTPVTYAPYLNDDSTDPVYLLDWQWLAIGVMAGWENELTQPYMVPDMHLVSRVDLDASLQMICTDLRRQAVVDTAG